MAWETITREGYCLTYPGSPLVPPDWIAEQGASQEGDATYDHTFCGPQDEPVVMCPNCDQPMLQLFAFDTNDPRLNLPRRDHRLRLIYCWGCNLYRRVVEGSRNWYSANSDGKLVHIEDPLRPKDHDISPVLYRINTDGSIEFLQYQKGRDITLEWYNGFGASHYPVSFPAVHVSLMPISAQFLEYISLVNVRPDLSKSSKSLNLEDIESDFDEQLENAELAMEEISVPWHQYGAEPLLAIVPGSAYLIRCPDCNEIMPFWTLVADANTSPHGFTGDDYMQTVFHLCHQCSVIAAYSVSGD